MAYSENRRLEHLTKLPVAYIGHSEYPIPLRAIRAGRNKEAKQVQWRRADRQAKTVLCTGAAAAHF
jgi:hypothetical protein